MRHPRASFAAALAATALLAACVPAAAVPAEGPTSTRGAAGLGDRLNPRLGNGGYDVLHYDLDLRYATSSPSQSIDGNELILARATQALSRFNLDFAGDSVGGVLVNHEPAQFVRRGEELIITPAHLLPMGAQFDVKILHFLSTPTEINSDIDASTAFFITPDGSLTAPQPYYAHLIYPCNDHPRDKATFSFHFNVPAGGEAVANGVETGHQTQHGRTTWDYSMDQPMATELTQLAVGNWELSEPQTVGSVVLRDVTAPELPQGVQEALANEPSHLAFMQARVGSYPFDVYGSLIVNADVGFALETQTLSLFDTTMFNDLGPNVFDAVMLHELSHMWFGDSVSPWEWSDLWLNEGHASWYEFLYAESKGFLDEDTAGYPDEEGYSTLNDLMRAVYRHGDQWRADFGPVAKPYVGGSIGDLFSYNVYHGGALVLYALRQKIGKPAFDQVERAWVTQYQGKSASTADFIALASEVSGRNLTTFLRKWLYYKTTPAMPGHPDWTVDPVEHGVAPATPSRRFR